jgi:hypothetical protein
MRGNEAVSVSIFDLSSALALSNRKADPVAVKATISTGMDPWLRTFHSVIVVEWSILPWPLLEVEEVAYRECGDGGFSGLYLASIEVLILSPFHPGMSMPSCRYPCWCMIPDGDGFMEKAVGSSANNFTSTTSSLICRRKTLPRKPHARQNVRRSF